MSPRRFNKLLADGAAWIAGLSFLAIFVVNTLAVVGRYSGWYSLIWSLDFTRLGFVWVVFFGAAAATHSRSHLAIEFFRDLLPAPMRRAATLFNHVVFLALLGVLIVMGWAYGIARLSVPYIQLGVPQGWAYLALPVSAALMALFTLEALIDDIRGTNDPEPSTDTEA